MTAHHETGTGERLADRLEAAKDNAVWLARIWKQEAQTANATIAEIYRLVGSKAGNWNGAEPVREALASHAAERDAGEFVAVPRATLKHWRELVDLNPADLAPRIDRALTAAPSPPTAPAVGMKPSEFRKANPHLSGGALAMAYARQGAIPNAPIPDIECGATVLARSVETGKAVMTMVAGAAPAAVDETGLREVSGG